MEKIKFRKVRTNKSIAIGGMIAFGKSTLTRELSKLLNYKEITEIDERDELTQLLLEKMYKRDGSAIYGPLFQIYFLLERFKKYDENCWFNSIFDRTIFEDWIFAKENINDPAILNYYGYMWDARIREMLYIQGVPKLYVILDGDWDLFKERVYKRGRPYEIENFKENETYFKNLVHKYKTYLINICISYGIDYIVVDAKTPAKKNAKLIKEWIQIGEFDVEEEKEKHEEFLRRLKED